MRKKVQIHMLPTDKYAAFFTNKRQPDIFQMGDNNIDNPKWQGQHLYFTSDEEIKGNNEWCIYDNGKTRKTCRAKELLIHPYRKIVAATDPKLKDKAGYYDNLSIPDIPLDFIKKYVEENGNIKEVELEYTQVGTGTGYHDYEWHLKLHSDGTVIIHDIKEKMYTREEMRIATWIIWDRWCPYFNQEEKKSHFDKWFDETYPKTI